MTVTTPRPAVTPTHLEAGAAAHPGKSAAVWLLTRDAFWVTDEAFLTTARRCSTGAKVCWPKFAQAAVASDAPAYQVAIALSAAKLAGHTYKPVPERNSHAKREQILARDKYRCLYCGAEATTVDHVVPRALGGRSSWLNLVAACEPCNTEKADRPLEELGWSLRLRTPWTADRIQRALGPDGQALVTAALARRDQSQAALDTALRCGLTAALNVLGLPAQRAGLDALTRDLTSRLAAAMTKESA